MILEDPSAWPQDDKLGEALRLPLPLRQDKTRLPAHALWARHTLWHVVPRVQAQAGAFARNDGKVLACHAERREASSSCNLILEDPSAGPQDDKLGEALRLPLPLRKKTINADCRAKEARNDGKVLACLAERRETSSSCNLILEDPSAGPQDDKLGEALRLPLPLLKKTTNADCRAKEARNDQNSGTSLLFHVELQQTLPQLSL